MKSNTPFLPGFWPVAKPLQATGDCEGLVVESVLYEPFSFRRAKCGSAPSAIIGSKMSGLSPSNPKIITFLLNRDSFVLIIITPFISRAATTAIRRRTKINFLYFFTKPNILFENITNNPKKPAKKAIIKPPALAIVKPVPGSIYEKNMSLL